MAKLFKSGEAVLQQALDLSRRRDFVKARQKFIDASEKFAKEGAPLYSNLCRAYADLMLLSGPTADAGLMLGLARFLRTTLGDAELRPGPRGISAGDLATELQLMARNTNLMATIQSGGGNNASVAQALQSLANDYRQLGNRVLFVPEFFHHEVVSAESRFPVLMAFSFEALGAEVQSSDPLSAAEHFQTAQQYWSQAGNPSRAAYAGGQIERLSLQAKCWFCGREGAGHGVQFASMLIDLDVTGLRGHDASPLPSIDKGGRHLYVCKGCNSAMRVLVERVAHEQATQMAGQLRAEMQALEARLRARIPGAGYG